MNQDLQVKYEKLQGILRDMGSALVAFSGGVDSTLLLKVARDVLGDSCAAATACSETYPSHEIDLAKELASGLGVRQLILDTDELSDDKFASNPPDRCYFCKKELWGKLTGLAAENGLAFVLDGANADDVNDFRPGSKAGREYGIRSPLKEAGFTKDDIRVLARESGLSNWDKPSFACLSSRFPYGERITPDKLVRVGEAERFIMSLGIGQLRVRHHGGIARIEVSAGDMGTIMANGDAIVGTLKGLGFRYVTIDLQGYRMGSMNETLTEGTKESILGA